MSQDTYDLVFVGYRSIPRIDAASMTPDFQAPSNYKEPAAIEKYVTARREKFLSEEAAYLPYVGQLVDVVLISLRSQRLLHVDKQQYPHEMLGGVIATEMKDWYHDELDNRDGRFVRDPVRFMGFDIRSFVKMASTEAAENATPMAPAFWHGADHRDLWNILLPDCKELGLLPVITRFGGAPGAVDELSASFGTGKSPWADVIWGARLCGLMGLMPGLASNYSAVVDKLVKVYDNLGAMPKKPKIRKPATA